MGIEEDFIVLGDYSNSMRIKENFIYLFSGHENEINELEDSFPIKAFSYMITSQRTMSKIKDKFNLIMTGNPSSHQNFWPDLKRLGLAESNTNQLSEFGKIVNKYFNEVEDDFKREHFILHNIRHGNYNIPEDVQNEYNAKINELKEFLDIIPTVNELGKELLKNPNKLLVSEFLNTFPYALKKYYELEENQQNDIAELNENKLRNLFYINDGPINKIVNRLGNVWRVPERRVNFVKSAILSEYEDLNNNEEDNDLLLPILDTYHKILNKRLLEEIISYSNKINISFENDKTILTETRFSEEQEIVKVELSDLVSRYPPKTRQNTEGRSNSPKNYFSKPDKKLGKSAEKWVLDFEKNKLFSMGKEDLSMQVEDVSSKNLGYDILSFDEDGTNIFIEVKATKSIQSLYKFHITSNEIITAQEHGEKYYIYRVFLEGHNNWQFFLINNPFSTLNLSFIEIRFENKIIKPQTFTCEIT